MQVHFEQIGGHLVRLIGDTSDFLLGGFGPVWVGWFSTTEQKATALEDDPSRLVDAWNRTQVSTRLWTHSYDCLSSPQSTYLGR